MTFEGTVCHVKDDGNDVEVTLVNVRRLTAAHWRAYSNGVTFKAPDTQARIWYVGRRVRVQVTPL